MKVLKKTGWSDWPFWKKIWGENSRNSGKSRIHSIAAADMASKEQRGETLIKGLIYIKPKWVSLSRPISLPYILALHLLFVFKVLSHPKRRRITSAYPPINNQTQQNKKFEIVKSIVVVNIILSKFDIFLLLWY